MSSLASKVIGVLAFASFLASSVALPEPNTVGFRFEKKRVNADELPTVLSKRQSGTVNSPIANEILLYFINVTVGTPAQPFSLQLDTGSSDIWFPIIDSDICQARSIACSYGAYDYDRSRTARQLLDYPNFEIQYVDGSTIQGVYVSDVLTIGSTSLTNMTMAAAVYASRGIGIMGIGFREGESSNVGRNGFTYPNVINVLKDQGHIRSLSYSLWLDDLQSNVGSILFGGVDTDKYQGSLVALPIQNDVRTNSVISFTVAWNGLTVTGENQSIDLSPSTPQPAILDSGTTHTYVPDRIAEEIYNAFGVLTDPQYGNVVRCALADNDFTFNFEFGGKGGALIKVPLAEFVTPLITRDGRQLSFRDGSDACTFAIDGAGSDPILFGDSFLRSAYVVYDLENLEIGLAQTNFNSNPNNGKVQAIGTDGIPDVARTASEATVQQTFTGRVLQTIEQTATDDGGIVQATDAVTRTASLTLTGSASATGTGSSGSSGSSNTATSAKGFTAVASIVILAFTLGFSLLLG